MSTNPWNVGNVAVKMELPMVVMVVEFSIVPIARWSARCVMNHVVPIAIVPTVTVSFVKVAMATVHLDPTTLLVCQRHHYAVVKCVRNSFATNVP